MKYATAKSLIRENIEIMSLEQLQKHRVRLIDAWRESKASYGMAQAVMNGFYVRVLCHQADGYAPKDKFLTSNLSFAIDNVIDREQMLLRCS